MNTQITSAVCPSNESLNESTPIPMNKNIKKLRPLKEKNLENYFKIYRLLGDISFDEDHEAMQYAINEGYCDATNQDGETFIDHSMMYGNYNIPRFMIENGANYISSRYFFFCSDLEFIRYIVKIPHIDVNAKGTYHETALILAARKNRADIVKFLLTIPGINVNDNSSGESALTIASWLNLPKIVQILLTHPDIDVNARTSNGGTALTTAAWSNNIKVVELLVKDPRIDANIQNNYNNTALSMASSFGYIEIVRLLLTIPGIDVNIKGENNKTALEKALNKGHTEIAQLLRMASKTNANI